MVTDLSGRRRLPQGSNFQGSAGTAVTAKAAVVDCKKPQAPKEKPELPKLGEIQKSGLLIAQGNRGVVRSSSHT